VTVKGQEFPPPNVPTLQGMGFAFANSNRGACILRGYMVSSEVFRIPWKTDPRETAGKPELLKAFQDATAAVDSSGLCVFTTFAWTMNDIQPQIQAACGGDWSLESLLQTGERIWNLERDFNLAAGITARDDTLPPRLLNEPCKTGASQGMVAELGKMLPEYYSLRGWSPDGVPTADTRARLGL